ASPVAPPAPPVEPSRAPGRLPLHPTSARTIAARSKTRIVMTAVIDRRSAGGQPRRVNTIEGDKVLPPCDNAGQVRGSTSRRGTMTRRTLGTVKVMMVFGAVAAAACSAPPAPDGTVEARRSALEGDAGTTGGAGAGGSGGPMGGAG